MDLHGEGSLGNMKEMTMQKRTFGSLVDRMLDLFPEEEYEHKAELILRLNSLWVAYTVAGVKGYVDDDEYMSKLDTTLREFLPSGDDLPPWVNQIVVLSLGGLQSWKNGVTD